MDDALFYKTLLGRRETVIARMKAAFSTDELTATKANGLVGSLVEIDTLLKRDKTEKQEAEATLAKQIQGVK
jgi:hypothetical protein